MNNLLNRKQAKKLWGAQHMGESKNVLEKKWPSDSRHDIIRNSAITIIEILNKIILTRWSILFGLVLRAFLAELISLQPKPKEKALH
jgi:hypothetical protein